MKVPFEIDLDEIFVGGDWDTTLAEIMKEEIAGEVRRVIKASVKSNTKLKKAIKALENKAAEQILESIK
jgi:hypothetical protein